MDVVAIPVISPGLEARRLGRRAPRPSMGRGCSGTGVVRMDHRWRGVARVWGGAYGSSMERGCSGMGWCVWTVDGEGLLGYGVVRMDRRWGEDAECGGLDRRCGGDVRVRGAPGPSIGGMLEQASTAGGGGLLISGCRFPTPATPFAVWQWSRRVRLRDRSRRRCRRRPTCERFVGRRRVRGNEW